MKKLEPRILVEDPEMSCYVFYSMINCNVSAQEDK